MKKKKKIWKIANITASIAIGVVAVFLIILIGNHIFAVKDAEISDLTAITPNPPTPTPSVIPSISPTKKIYQSIYKAPKSIAPTIAPTSSTTISSGIPCIVNGVTYRASSAQQCANAQEPGAPVNFPTVAPVVFPNSASQPTSAPADNTAAQQQAAQCISNVQNEYNTKIQSCYSQYGGGSSAGDACAQSMQEQEQQALNGC